MTPDEFRALALSFANVKCVSVFGVTEFWINGVSFASLASPDPGMAILKLSREDQAALMVAARVVFSPAPGGAGGQGVTQMRLVNAKAAHARRALKAAYDKAARSLPRGG
jgi:hypothetical protein